MRVTVLGATGTAGRVAIPVFVAAGHAVRAHVRRGRADADVASLGAEPVRGDTDDVGVLRDLLAGSDAVVDLRVVVPPASRAGLPGAWRPYARLRGEGTRRLVEAALAADVARLVRDTVTMVYADGADRVLTEDDPVAAPGPLAANLEGEQHLARFTDAGGVGVALRFGGFYGPDDTFSRTLVRAARRGRVPIAGDPDGWTSAIHIDDLGSALLVALSAPAGVYNVVDDEPLRRRDLLRLLAEAAGVAEVRGLPAWTMRAAPAPLRALTRSQRVGAARFHALGWRPSVPSRRQGWTAVFGADATRA